MKYVIQDRIIQVNSPNTNKKYLSSISGWYHHLRRSTSEKTVNVICRLTDINHSSVEGEALSIIFKREEVDIQ
jgi:hypothetical protein